jgi:hypothetical protein
MKRLTRKVPLLNLEASGGLHSRNPPWQEAGRKGAWQNMTVIMNE